MKPIMQRAADSEDDVDHVDYFIWSCFREHCYARFVLLHYRQSAAMKNDFKEIMKAFPLFCTYGSIRFRVTGASDMGDVWLSRDYEADDGYDHRVLWRRCSEWSQSP